MVRKGRINMGLKTENEKLNVQKARLKKVFVSMLQTNIDIMTFQLTLTDKPEEVKGIKKLIQDSKKAIDKINNVQHYEILVSLYNSFINGKETYFVLFVKTVVSKNTISKWDKSEKGFKDFLEAEKKARAKSEQEAKENAEKQEIIKKAREEGKKIEMIFKDGKLQPTIVEEKAN